MIGELHLTETEQAQYPILTQLQLLRNELRADEGLHHTDRFILERQVKGLFSSQPLVQYLERLEEGSVNHLGSQ